MQTELQHDDTLGMMVELGRGRGSSVASGGATIVKQEAMKGHLACDGWNAQGIEWQCRRCKHRYCKRCYCMYGLCRYCLGPDLNNSFEVCRCS